MATDNKLFAFNPFTGNLDITQDVSAMVDGPASSTDNALARFDGTTGKLMQNSTGILSDTGELSALTRLDVDNLRLDGNTIITTNTNGDLNLDADGTGNINAQAPLLLSQDGVAATEAVTKQQLDAAISGVDVKEGVLVATTANITLSGEQTIDGVLTSASRVLVKNQSTQTENGIYVSAAGAWSRSSDANTGSELEGALVTVQSGSTQANTGWYQTADSITIGVTNIVFVQFFGAGTYTADGQGIELSGSTFSLELDGTTLSKSSSGLKIPTNGVTDNEIRLTYSNTLRSRNSTNTGDIAILRVFTSNQVRLMTTTVPDAHNTYDFGSSALSWSAMYTTTLTSPAALAITGGSSYTITSTGSAQGIINTANITGSSTNTSGALTVRTGAKSGSGTGNTGTWTAGTGDNSSSAASTTGNVSLKSGEKTVGTGASGLVTVGTGNSTDTSGILTLSTGDSSGGNSGAINITTGTGATRGVISLSGSSVSVNSTKITNLATPTAASDASTKEYADMFTVNVSSNVTLTDHAIHFVDTSASRTLTLPAPTSSLRILIKDITGTAETNNITVNPAAAQTIDGAASLTINSNYASTYIVSDGTNYYIL